MSYILDALKKAEYERELAQFVDCNDDFKRRPRFSFATNSWVWGTVILVIMVLTMLLWPSKTIHSQQEVYIVPPAPAQSVSLSEQLGYNYNY